MKSANKWNRRISRRANPSLYRHDTNTDLLGTQNNKEKWKWNVLQSKQLLMQYKCITTMWKCTIFSRIYLFISICTKQASLCPVALTGSVSSILKKIIQLSFSVPKPIQQKNKNNSKEQALKRTTIAILWPSIDSNSLYIRGNIKKHSISLLDEDSIESHNPVRFQKTVPPFVEHLSSEQQQKPVHSS